MNWRNRVFENFTLYAVTNLCTASKSELRKIEAAYRGGADIVQLRSKTLSDSEFLRIGAQVREIAVKYRKLFFVNDRVDLGILLEADGVHLGQGDVPLAEARKLTRVAGKRMLFGISTHNLRQAIAAERQGADYIGVGPVFATPTKPGKKPVGLKFVRQAAKRIKIPFVAIGGIDRRNIGVVMSAGASRAAVIRAVFSSKNPSHAARDLKNKLER